MTKPECEKLTLEDIRFIFEEALESYEEELEFNGPCYTNGED